MGRYYRSPHTQQERRFNASHEYRRVEVSVGGEIYELRVRIRGKRSLKMLVEAWHDLPRQVQRSWKEHRRTQYKGKTVGAQSGPLRSHAREPLLF